MAPTAQRFGARVDLVPARRAPARAPCRRAFPSSTPDRVALLSVESSRRRAMPKSSTFTPPARVRKMLSGLMSRWTMSFSCAAARDVEHLVGDEEHLFDDERPRLALEASREGLAVEQLHHEEDRAVVGRPRRR